MVTINGSMDESLQAAISTAPHLMNVQMSYPFASLLYFTKQTARPIADLFTLWCHVKQ
jgi:hypothetical protein